MKVVDWTQALEQVGGDTEFLQEVLNDLLGECDAAVEEIAKGLAKYQDGFDPEGSTEIRKAAHRIKGSASYLFCDRLKDISLKLQDAGHAGEVGAPSPAKLLNDMTSMFTDFKDEVESVKDEIERYFKA